MPRLKKQADAATNSEEGGRVNKMEIVRKALGKLGDKAKPKEMHAYILKTYKVEIGTDTISNYKGLILRKAAGESRLNPSPEPAAAPPAKKEAVNGGVNIEDVRAVKELADRIGAAKVRALMEVLYQ
jgi:hypothetical protein